jgi:Glucitol operon activator
MRLEMFFAILFILLVIQVIGTHMQVKQYRNAVRRLHKLGNIGIGGQRKKIGAGNIVIIACKNDGVIMGAEIMEGITIFNNFKTVVDVTGKNIYELKQEYMNMPVKRQKLYKGHIQALEALELRLQPKESEELMAVAN